MDYSIAENIRNLDLEGIVSAIKWSGSIIGGLVAIGVSVGAIQQIVLEKQKIRLAQKIIREHRSLRVSTQEYTYAGTHVYQEPSSYQYFSLMAGLTRTIHIENPRRYEQAYRSTEHIINVEYIAIIDGRQAMYTNEISVEEKSELPTLADYAGATLNSPLLRGDVYWIDETMYWREREKMHFRLKCVNASDR